MSTYTEKDDRLNRFRVANVANANVANVRPDKYEHDINIAVIKQVYRVILTYFI